MVPPAPIPPDRDAAAPRPREDAALAVAPDALRIWQKFHIRLTLAYGGLVFVVLTAMGVLFYQRGAEAELRGLQGRLRVAAVAVASAVTPDAIRALRGPGDQSNPAYRELVERFKAVCAAEADLYSIYVLRPTGVPGQMAFVADYVARGSVPAATVGQLYDATQAHRILEGLVRPTVEDAPYTDEWGTLLSGYTPVRDADGTALALVGVDVFADRIEEMRRGVRAVTFALYGVAAAVLALISLVVARNVRRPLRSIVDATGAIAQGDFSARSGIARSDEFGILGRRFDDMARGLQEREFIKATFGSYVSPTVVRKVLERRQSSVRGQRRHVAVLFADIRKFTSLSEQMSPEDVVALLNGYLDRMTQVISARDGHIDKFIGDAIMANWGALEDERVPEGPAVEAAVQMQRALASFNVEQAARGRAALEVGIGLHSGEAVAGTIGSSKKLEFTVLGDTVNIASRLEGLCKLYRAGIVASRAVVDAAGSAHPGRRIDRAIVQGREVATDVCEILDAEDPRAARVPTWERAVTSYYERRFDEAAGLFEEAARGLNDPGAAFQIERCRVFAASPPPMDWTGVERRAK